MVHSAPQGLSDDWVPKTCKFGPKTWLKKTKIMLQGKQFLVENVMVYEIHSYVTVWLVVTIATDNPDTHNHSKRAELRGLQGCARLSNPNLVRVFSNFHSRIFGQNYFDNNFTTEKCCVELKMYYYCAGPYTWCVYIVRSVLYLPPCSEQSTSVWN